MLARGPSAAGGSGPSASCDSTTARSTTRRSSAPSPSATPSERIRTAHGVRVEAVATDITTPEGRAEALLACERLGGSPDILINNAGRSAASGLEELSDEAWQEDLDLKLMGAIRMCRGAVPHMRKKGGGSIVNATTGAGKAPGSLALPTSVSRAAGNNLTKSLANELAKDKIRVNAVCIGLIKSAQWERRSEKGSLEELYTELGNKVPLGRVGEAEEYADLVAFLCSARGTYITGTAINLDGGLCPVI